MPPAEDNRETNNSGQPYRTQIVEALDTTNQRTMDFDLFSTIKSGTAQVETLKLLIPGFEIIEELGRGAYGVVYRARDEKLDRQVAIKVSLLDDPERREEYIKEARHAAQLDRPGIVPVFQVGTLAGGQPFVVQRLIDGKTLRNSLADSERMGAHHACWLISEIASVVAGAHALGMIHRDIKPDNILLDKEGKPWVADFGLAIFEEDQKDVAGQRAGTPLYMSPEQLSGRAEWLDGRTDIYAMGVMLYEMLTGRLPFEARSLRELELQVLHRAPKPITQRAPHLPAAVDVIFNNCCAKKVDDRYANALELAADLHLLMEDLPQFDQPGFSPGPAVLSAGSGGSLGSAGRRSSPSRISERRKTLRQSDALQETLVVPPSTPARRRWVLPAIGLVGVLGIVAGLMIFSPAKRSNQAQELAGRLSNNNSAEPSSITAGLAGGSEGSHSASTTVTDAVVPAASVADSLGNESLETVVKKQEAPPVETVPQRPFRVSRGGAGTHTTIAAALEMAEVDEEITILPGTYVEQLKPLHSVHLIGEGSRDEIVIIANDISPIVVDGPPTLQLTNLTVEGNKTDQANFNTIEVLNGSTLVLQNCNVYSRSWDCVKLYPGSELVARGCGFRTSAHPAIHAMEATQLQLIDSIFDIRPMALETPHIPVGLQAHNCTGLVQGCKFTGSGDAIGVHWLESTQPIAIENCSFENCDIGVLLQSCSAARIGSEKQSAPNEQYDVLFSGCRTGLLLEDSRATVQGCEISGAGGTVGISVSNSSQHDAPQPLLTLSDCSIDGYDVGLTVNHAQVAGSLLQIKHSGLAGIKLVEQSRLKLTQSKILTSEKAGIHIEDAAAQLNKVQVSDHKYAAVWVDAGPDALRTSECTLERSLVGVWVLSGTINMQGGSIVNNECGIMSTSYQQIGRAPSQDVSPIVIELQGIDFDSNTNGNLKVQTPCAVKIAAELGAADRDRVEAIVSEKLVGKRQGELTVYETAE